MNPPSTPARTSLLVLLASSIALAGVLSGCAPPPPALRVRAADVAGLGPLTLERPIIIEFQEGDVLPLDFKLDGPFLRTPADMAPIPLRAARHFYLRIDKSGLKSSLDGQDFDWKPTLPGQFQAGLGVTKEKGFRANITIRTPRPPGLSRQ